MDQLNEYINFDQNYEVIIGGYGLQNESTSFGRTLKFAKFEVFYTKQQFQQNFFYLRSKYSLTCPGDSGEYDYN